MNHWYDYAFVASGLALVALTAVACYIYGSYQGPDDET